MYEKSGRRVMVKYQIVNDVGLDNLARLVHAGASLGQFLCFKRDDRIRDQEEIYYTIKRYGTSVGRHPLADVLTDNVRQVVRRYVPGWQEPTG